MHCPSGLYITPGSVKRGGGILILSRRSIPSGEALGSVRRLDYPGRRRADHIERANISVARLRSKQADGERWHTLHTLTRSGAPVAGRISSWLEPVVPTSACFQRSGKGCSSSDTLALLTGWNPEGLLASPSSRDPQSRPLVMCNDNKNRFISSIEMRL